MSELTRLRKGGGSEFERFLLDGAADEEPSSDVEAILMGGLGPVGPGLLAPAASDPHAAALVSQATGHPVSMLLFKVGALGLVVGGLLSAGWLGTERQGESTRAALAQTSPIAREAVQPEEPQPSAALTPPVIVQAAQVAQPSAPRANAHTEPVVTNSLHEELSALERAKQALDGGDADRALALLTTYERKFPRGTLRQEATVLRVKALRARGSEDQAAELSAAFLQQNPSSAHAPRLEGKAAAKP